MRWEVAKLRSRAAKKTDRVLGWIQLFLKGARTLGIRLEGDGIAEVVRLREVAIRGHGGGIIEVQ